MLMNEVDQAVALFARSGRRISVLEGGFLEEVTGSTSGVYASIDSASVSDNTPAATCRAMSIRYPEQYLLDFLVLL